MIDFHAARLAAAVAGAPRFAEEGLRGTYWVSPDGYETPDVFVVVDGAAEDLRDGDREFRPMDVPATIVFKTSGDIAYIPGEDLPGEFWAEAREVHDADPTPVP